MHTKADRSAAATLRRRSDAAQKVRVVLRPPAVHASPAIAASQAFRPIEPIRRGFAVLEAFNENDGWLGNQEIAELTGIPRATVSRLTQTLASLGCLHHSHKTRKYRLAASVLGLGYAAIADANIVTLARPVLQSLADETGTFVSLVGRDGLDVVMLEICHSATTMVTLGLRVGARLPIATSPLGWALLAGLPESERSYLLDHARRHHRSQWPVLRQRIAESVEQVQRPGFCVSTDEWAPNVVAVAVPFSLPSRAPMAIGCAGPRRWLTKARLNEQIGPALYQTVKRLTKSLATAETPRG